MLTGQETSILDYGERLSASEIAEQVRVRFDWKYTLHLPLTDTGFEEGIPTDFRQWLASRQAGLEIVHCVLVRLVELKLRHGWGELALVPDTSLGMDDF